MGSPRGAVAPLKISPSLLKCLIYYCKLRQKEEGYLMPKRIVAWGVLLFSFAMILLGMPKGSGWSVGFDWTYHVPTVTMPAMGYWIWGGIAGVVSLFLVMSAFWETWSNNVEEFIIKNLHGLLFVIYLFTYIIGYLKGVGSLVSNFQPNWLVSLAFYAGFVLFLIIIPAHYFKWLNELKSKRRQPAPATHK